MLFKFLLYASCFVYSVVSCQQIKIYLERRVLAPAECMSALRRTPSLQQLVRNPFILNLFANLWPEICQATQDRVVVTRYRMYGEFVHHWFRKEVAKLPDSRKAALGLIAGVVTIDELLARFELLSGLLAGEMLKASSLGVPVGFQESAPGVWESTTDLATEWVVEDAEAAAQQSQAELELRSRAEKKKAVIAASAAAMAAVDELRVACPLRRSTDSMSLEFLHRSFLEYFYGRLVLLIAGSHAPLRTRVSRTVTVLSTPGRRIQSEPEALYLLADHWHHNVSEDSEVTRARECLLEVIRTSRDGGFPYWFWGGVPSSNAATLLNWMGEPMLRQSWDGVVLEGADLTHAVMCGTSLSGAHMRGCRLEAALLVDVNLRCADLSMVEFGERVPLIGHTDNVCSVAVCIHPTSGRLMVASGSVDGVVHLWDLATGRTVREPLLTDVTCVALGVDPTTATARLLVASGSNDGTVRMWDVDAGQRVGTRLRGHGGQVTCVALGVNPATSRPMLISGSVDCTVRRWDAVTGQYVGKPWTGHRGPVRSVALGMDPTTSMLVVASGSIDGTVRLWDASADCCLRDPLVGHRGGVYCVALGVDSRTGRLMVASGSEDCTVLLWDVGSVRPSGSLPHNGIVASLALGMDPRTERFIVVSGSEDGILRVWDISSGRLVEEAFTRHSEIVTCVALGADPGSGRLVMVSSGGVDCTVQVHEMGRGRSAVEPSTGHSQRVTSTALCVNPSTGRLVVASGSFDSTVHLWDAASGRKLGEPRFIRTTSSGVNCVTMAVDPSTKRMLVAHGAMDGVVYLWDADSGGPVGEPLTGHGDQIASVAMCVNPISNSLVLVSGSLDHTVRVWDVSSGRPLGDPLTGHCGPVSCVALAVDPNCQRLMIATGSYDTTVRLWDASRGLVVGKPLVGHNGRVTCVSLGVHTPTNRLMVVSGSYDCTARVWYVDSEGTGSRQCSVKMEHSDRVTSVAVCVHPITRDMVVASGSWDETVRVWIAATACLLSEPLAGHGGFVTSAALGVDPETGKLVVASGGDDNAVCVWELHCSSPFRDLRSVELESPGSHRLDTTHSLRWLSRTQRHQSLVARGACIDGAVGLSEAQLALLVHRGMVWDAGPP